MPNPKIHWEVIDDTGTNTFNSYEEAFAYYQNGVEIAKEEDSEYQDQVHLQCVVSLRHYENGKEDIY